MLELIKRRVQQGSVIDSRSIVANWIGTALNLEGARRGNVQEFLAYAFFYRSVASIYDAGIGNLLCKMTGQLEETWGQQLEEGYTPGLQGMNHLWVRSSLKC